MKKKKKDSGTKNILLQWLFPTIAFFLVVSFMLYHYGMTQNKSISQKTEKNIAAVAKGYATQVSGYLQQIESAQEPVSILLDRIEAEQDASVKECLTALLSTNLIYSSAIVDENGTGFRNTGEPVELDIKNLKEFDSGSGTFYICMRDEFLGGAYTIAVVTPLSHNRGYVISYFKPELLKKYITISDYDGRTWFAVMDAEGKLIYSSAMLSTEGNFFEYLKANNKDEKTIETIQDKIPLTKETNLVAKIGKDEVYCAFTPLEVNDWYFVMGVTNSYVNTIKNSEWIATRNMVVNMIGALALFFALVVIINVISRKRYSDQSKALAKKADTDLLTELNNKIATERKIREYIRDNQDSQALMFVFDIDNFKKINDTRGHAFGDEVLRTIGMRLKAEFRMSDVIGRVGGDEFILLLKNIKDESILKKESGRVAGLFRDFKVGQYSKYKVTASIGCAVFPRDADNFEDLYKAADRALYKAKQRGKNQLAFYRDEEEESGQEEETK
ncbi:MAG: sensor domain-containing diguanylate cyclase [Roseburia sp.]|nr:sensor domain-containing diguanylate cyclase [Roseburia sp.]MCM1277531.1 sensor domain-containing diguanylate cyclase [Robinsoniella sp.]